MSALSIGAAALAATNVVKLIYLTVISNKLKTGCHGG